jgi:hypothetical protein
MERVSTIFMTASSFSKTVFGGAKAATGSLSRQRQSALAGVASGVQASENSLGSLGQNRGPFSRLGRKKCRRT